MAPILVLSANSHVGAETVRQLTKAGAAVRSAVRHPKAGDTNTVAADLDKPETLPAALAGIETAVLTTGAGASQPQQHSNFIQAAKKAGVRHIIRVSVIGADLHSSMTLMRTNAETERELEESGMAFTHLRPHQFMENFLGQISTMRSMGKIFSCAGDAALPFVSVPDIAACAAAAALHPEPAGKTYIVTGPAGVTFAQIAAKFSAALGIPVEYIIVPEQAAAQGMAAAGIPEWIANDLAARTSDFSRGKHIAVSSAVRDLTGTPGISFDQFLANNRAALS